LPRCHAFCRKQAIGADIALPASDLAAIDAFAQANGLMADVPEPASLGLAALMTTPCSSAGEGQFRGRKLTSRATIKRAVQRSK
jgi:hypothetical protein